MTCCPPRMGRHRLSPSSETCRVAERPRDRWCWLGPACRPYGSVTHQTRPESAEGKKREREKDETGIEQKSPSFMGAPFVFVGLLAGLRNSWISNDEGLISTERVRNSPLLNVGTPLKSFALQNPQQSEIKLRKQFSTAWKLFTKRFLSIDHWHATPWSLGSGPPDQSTWMFTKS